MWSHSAADIINKKVNKTISTVIVFKYIFLDREEIDEFAHCGCKQSCSEMDFRFTSSSFPIVPDTLKERFNNELRSFYRRQSYKTIIVLESLN